MGCASSFIKKTVKKAMCLQKLETKYCLLLFSDVNIQTNKNIFTDLLNFTVKCIGGQIKAYCFLFLAGSDAKSKKSGEC